MKRTISILSSLLLLIACTPYGVTKVNLDKASRQKTAAKDLYARVDVLPLLLPETVRLPENSRLEVTDNLVLLLDASGEQIVVMDADGAFVTQVDAGAPITDFSACGKLLDILCGNEVKEYNLQDFSLTRTLSLPTDGVTLTELQRRDDEVLLFSGFNGESAYDCEYFVSRDHFPVMKNPVYKAEDYDGGGFFRCNDSTFFFCRPGKINAYTSDDFIYPFLLPDFGRHNPVVTQVQMTPSHIFMQLCLQKGDALLVYDRAGKQHRLIRTTTEGLAFPLGVIHKGVNYFCCPARHLGSYVLPEDMTVPENTEYILLKYTL